MLVKPGQIKQMRESQVHSFKGIWEVAELTGGKKLFNYNGHSARQWHGSKEQNVNLDEREAVGKMHEAAVGVSVKS